MSCGSEVLYVQLEVCACVCVCVCVCVRACVCVCVTPPPVPACPQSVTAATLREDKEVRQFFSSLVETHLDRDSPLARVDLLQSSLLHGSEGADTLQELRALLKVGGGRAGQRGTPYH